MSELELNDETEMRVQLRFKTISIKMINGGSPVAHAFFNFPTLVLAQYSSKFFKFWYNSP